MRFPLNLLASAGAAFLIGLVLIVWVNPEVGFWNDVAKLRETDIETIRAENPGKPVMFFTGGSSTAFSVDPKIIEDACGIPAVNFGLPAGTGPRFIIDNTLKAMRRGDYLVIGLEPDFFSDDFDYPPSTLAFAMAVSSRSPSSAVGGKTFGARISLNEILTLARPGASYLVTLAYRQASGKGYRYQLKDYRYHGRLETPVRDQTFTPNDVLNARKLSGEGERLLKQIRTAADQRGLHVVYAMPWQFTSSKNARISRESNRMLIKQIERIMPVIEDGEAGVCTNRDHFSDSHLHLTASGSSLRSRAVARALQTWLSSQQ